MRGSRTLLAVWLLVAPGAAQGFAHNKLEFSNWWLTAREDHFPNFATGNVAGDGLFKVLPRTVLERADSHLVSGYRLAISIDDGYTGSFPVQIEVPGVQLYRTALQGLAGSTYEVPDLARPVGPQYDPIPLMLAADAAWVVEVEFDPARQNSKLRSLLSVPGLTGGQRDGIAIMALAKPGEQRSPSMPGVVMQSSFQERHIPPASRFSYSGSFDAVTGQIAMFGTTGQPSATGELYAALRFDNTTLQLFGDSSGGVLNDPQQFETHAGPGAYDTDMASRAAPAFFGIYVQNERFDPAGAPATHRVFPFVVSTSAAGPTTSVPIGGITMRVNPAELALSGLFIDAGFGGGFGTYMVPGVAGHDVCQFGVYVSPRTTVPVNPALRGATLWLQGVVLDANFALVDTTNVVRWTFR